METKIEELAAGPDGSAARLWDDFVAAHPNGHFLQSWAWGELRRSQGWQVQRLWALQGERPVSAAQVLARKRRGGIVAYMPRGPVCEPVAAAWVPLLEALRERWRGQAVVLRIEPHWADEAQARGLLHSAGLQAAPAVQPPSTLCLDLQRGEDALLADMKSKWRYNVRLAGRKGIGVERVDAHGLPEFERLMAQTAQRHGIAGRPPGYHAAVFASLGPYARLYAARFEAQTLAMMLVVHFGDTATYLYGASSEQERQRMPNHAMQWAAMHAACEEGLACYDMWGIPDAIGQAVVAGGDPDAVPAGEDGLWGVWGFKRGFGGDVWRAVGAWDDVYAPLRYGLGRRLARLRRS
jgi:lipid II:glycine glycyltransferase (peptidoglycan interpeptide bridge formation enzyme)